MLNEDKSSTPAGKPAPGLRIMIVEDEPDIATILTQLLSSQFEVVHAANGLEALERLNWYEPDLTIMDLMMPVLNGIDTTRAIKKDNEYMAMPVLFLTARKDNQSVRDAMMAGGDIYLEKPFEPAELFTRLYDIVTRHQLEPRPKRYSLQQIREEFEGAPQTVLAPPPKPAERMSLTEQLARAAAVPRARVVAVYSAEKLPILQQGLKTAFEFIGVRDPEMALDKVSAYQPDILLVGTHGTSISGVLLAHLLRVNRQFRVPMLLLLSETRSAEEQADADALKVHLLQWDGQDVSPVLTRLQALSSAPDFQRARKRLDYREILRREEPEDDVL